MLTIALPSLFSFWAGETIRFAHPVKLAVNRYNVMLQGSIMVTGAVMIACLIAQPGRSWIWPALAVLGTLLWHSLWYGWVWRRMKVH
jgi:hypothetical protein